MDFAGFDLDAFVAATLAEDLGERGDITSEAVIPADARFTGVMDTRGPIVVAGLPLAEAFFRALDPGVGIERLAGEGDAVPAGADLLRLRGRARAMLTALAVEPLRSVGEADGGYVLAVIARLQEMAIVRQVSTLKGRLQRMNPVEQADDYTKVFGQLLALEQQARSLRERAMGGLTP